MISTYRRIPADPADWFEPAEVKKAQDYQRPLNVVRAVALAISIAEGVALIFLHLAPRVANAMGFGPERWILRLIVPLVLYSIVDTVIDLPLSIWTTFVHEKKWGFSTQTPKGYVSDLLKGLVLGFVISIPLLLALWWLIRTTDLWWIWGWAVFFVFSGLLAFLYPILIAPIFNKFTPLADETLGVRLRDLANSQGMRIKAIQVMDASKRTRKDNAYFTGFGKTKQIVLFDNLLTQTPAVIASIVGHEIGHWKKRHLVRALFMALITTFAMFWILHFILTSKTILHWGGVSSPRDSAAWPIVFAAFALVFPFIGLVQSWFSRAFERQADVFALDVTKDYDAFVETEHGLSTRNLIDLAPSWWRYVRLSHPPPAERLELGKLWKAENVNV